jgi:hypothetical protein
MKLVSSCTFKLLLLNNNINYCKILYVCWINSHKCNYGESTGILNTWNNRLQKNTWRRDNIKAQHAINDPSLKYIF